VNSHRFATSTIGTTDNRTYSSVIKKPETAAQRYAPRWFLAECDQRYAEHHQIGECIEDAADIVEQLKRFLIAGPHVRKDGEGKPERSGEQDGSDGVRWRGSKRLNQAGSK